MKTIDHPLVLVDAEDDPDVRYREVITPSGDRLAPFFDSAGRLMMLVGRHAGGGFVTLGRATFAEDAGTLIFEDASGNRIEP
ncbi:MAG: hypothetical protein ABI841_05765 [Chloroflexota bacterium]